MVSAFGTTWNRYLMTIRTYRGAEELHLPLSCLGKTSGNFPKMKISPNLTPPTCDPASVQFSKAYSNTINDKQGITT
jgi:hypothetical protein